jgi:hypothetical protein
MSIVTTMDAEWTGPGTQSLFRRQTQSHYEKAAMRWWGQLGLWTESSMGSNKSLRLKNHLRVQWSLRNQKLRMEPEKT